MSFTILDEPERLVIPVNGLKRTLSVKWLLLLIAGLIGGIIGGVINGEIVLLVIFILVFFGLVSYQVTELHFDKSHKTIYIVYSFFGKIAKKRKLLDNYSAYQYGLEFEEIDSGEDHYKAFTLKAFNKYDTQDIYHFQTLQEAEAISKHLVKKLELVVKQEIKYSA